MKQSTLFRAATAAILVLGLSGLSATAAIADEAPAPSETTAAAPDTTAAAPAPAAEADPPAPVPAPDPSPAADPAPAPEAPAPAAREADAAASPAVVGPTAVVHAAARKPSGATTTSAADNFGAVYLCHATQGANPWISEHPNAQAAYNWHVDPPNDKNDHLTDIIPPFDYNDHGDTVHYPGKNLTTDFGGGITGAQILANDCVMPTVVTPAAVATAQTCSQGTQLVGGHIQLTVITGISYTITSPANANVPFSGSGLTGELAPGTYSVSFTHGPSVVTAVTSPFTVTIDAYAGACGTAPTSVTPHAVASQQTCDVDYQLVGGSIQLTMIAGVDYTITAPDLSNVAYNGSGLATGLAPGTYQVAYSLAPGLTSSVTTPFAVTVTAFDGICDATPYVLLAWQLPCGVASPWCPPGQNLVHHIDLTVPTLDALDDLLIGTCGDWQVDLEWDSPITDALIAAGILTAPNSPQEDHAYGAVPGNPWKYIDNPDCAAAPAAIAHNQTCSRAGGLVAGYIQVTVTPGVTYVITGPGGTVPFNAGGTTGDLTAGAYSVTYSLDPGYASAVVNPIPLTISDYDGDCAPPVEVTPAATPTAQTCSLDNLVQDGSIQLTVLPGVTYTITAPDGVTDVPFDVLGNTGPIAPGTYSVSFLLAGGYTTSVASPFDVVVPAFDGVGCDLVTDPLVIPAAVPSYGNCLHSGSFALSNDQNDPAAIEWTVTDATGTHTGIGTGTYPVTGGQTVTVDASPGPGYGFGLGTKTHWEFTFAAAGACLDTLAFTSGGAPGGLATIAVILLLAGAGAIAAHRRRRSAVS
jgi:hypothetical protein